MKTETFQKLKESGRTDFEISILAVGSWLSAALEDENACQEFKDDINFFFEQEEIYNAIEKCFVILHESKEELSIF